MCAKHESGKQCGRAVADFRADAHSHGDPAKITPNEATRERSATRGPSAKTWFVKPTQKEIATLSYFRRYAPLSVLAVVLVPVTGCGHRAVVVPRTEKVEAADSAAVDHSVIDIQSDPVAYLRKVEATCAALAQYTVEFTRTERRGLIFKSLQGPEKIKCWFRRNPFSVRMKWLDDRVKYGESTYVEGREKNQVRFTPRHGLFGLPPGLTKVDLSTPVTWGEAQRPVSEWGMEKLIQATLRSISEAKANGGAVIEYRGVERLENGRNVHHLRLRYPRPSSISSVQDLYIDQVTHLPAATVLTFADGRLDAMYTYENLEPNVTLTDDDFVLDIERQGAGRN